MEASGKTVAGRTIRTRLIWTKAVDHWHSHVEWGRSPVPLILYGTSRGICAKPLRSLGESVVSMTGTKYTVLPISGNNSLIPFILIDVFLLENVDVPPSPIPESWLRQCSRLLCNFALHRLCHVFRCVWLFQLLVFVEIISWYTTLFHHDPFYFTRLPSGRPLQR